jgi:ATP-binding cassette subfamily F protein 3
VPGLIALADIHKHYGPSAILDGVTLDFQRDHRVAVIGRNGAGKSTLCRIIIGAEEPDAGTVVRHPDLRLSWLEQQTPFQDGETATGFLERWSGRPSWECARLAARFQLGPALLETAVALLSGGLQTRLRLAGMLLKEPNFLVLDEPTNFLDLRTMLLLEEFLVGWRGGYLIVSHDRSFLKRTCRQTLEIGGGRATFFNGPLEDFFAHQEANRAQAEHHNASVEARRRELEDYIARNKARASTASQAQSKMKQLDRLRTIEIEHASSSASIRIPPVERRSGSVLRTKGLSIGYPDRLVARAHDIDLDRGSRVAIVGDNGQGKTTFIKTIGSAIAPLSGSFAWGHACRIGTYAQHVYTALDERISVREHLERCARASPQPVSSQAILDLAGGFLFHGDEVEKRIKVLSGGERARLCLAGLLLGRHDVLLMDEPTNHLDVETVEALAEALADYLGTVFFTSHDRTFVSLVANSILDVRDGEVRLYPDNYASYVWRLERETADADDDADAAEAPARAPSQGARKQDGRTRAQAAKELKALERRIGRLEEEARALGESLTSLRGEEARAAHRRLAELTQETQAAEARWLEIGESAGEGD